MIERSILPPLQCSLTAQMVQRRRITRDTVIPTDTQVAMVEVAVVAEERDTQEDTAYLRTSRLMMQVTEEDHRTTLDPTAMVDTARRPLDQERLLAVLEASDVVTAAGACSWALGLSRWRALHCPSRLPARQGT